MAPRLFTIVIGYGLDAFRPLGGHFWYAAGVVAPHVGAIIGIFIYDVVIGRHLQEKTEDREGVHASLIENMRELVFLALS